MDRIEEIEAAINNLPPEDFRRIANWFRERYQSLWDQQLDSDASTGRLDFFLRKSRQSPSKTFSAIGQSGGEICRDAPVLDHCFLEAGSAFATALAIIKQIQVSEAVTEVSGAD